MVRKGLRPSKCETNARLCSRFARVRVRPAHRDNLREELREPEWLLIEWPRGTLSH